MLALLGTGMAVVPTIFLFHPSIRALVFVPGYFVIAGYYWRTLGYPSLRWRRAIWGLSLLAQGAWFIWAVTRPGPLGGVGFSGDALIMWWGGSTAISLY